MLYLGVDMYYKRVPMNVKEAVLYETEKGFDTRDEFFEVMEEIAELYDTSLEDVLNIYYHPEECLA
jgi:hypothetical protein